MSTDLWTKLEAELESSELTAVSIPERIAPPAAKPSFKERLATSVLNGFIPLYLIGAVSLFLVGTVGGHHSGFGMELLLLAIVVWLLQPLLFRTRKSPVWLVALTPLITGGFVEVFTSATNIAGVYTRNDRRHFDEADVVNIVQSHIESYFSWGHFGIYLFLGVGLVFGLREVHRKFYWLDVKKSGLPRKCLSAIACIVLPVGLAGWTLMMAFSYSLTTEEESWKQQIHQQSARLAWTNKAPQGTEWWDAFLAAPLIEKGYGKGKTEERVFQNLAEARKAESLLLKEIPLIYKEGNRSEISFSLKALYILSRTPSLLQQPERVAIALARHPKLTDNHDDYRRTMLKDGLLKFVAETDIENLRNEEPDWDTETTRENFNNPLPGLDRLFAGSLQDESDGNFFRIARRNPDHLTLFGITFEPGLSNIYFRWKLRHRLAWWLELREKENLANLTAAEIRILLKNSRPTADQESDYLGYHVMMNNYVRPDMPVNILTAAAVLAKELRLRKAETGSWPESLPKLAEEKGLVYSHMHLVFDAESHTLTYYPPGKTKQDSTSWVLQ